ncbi:MAG: PPC domain-containing protein [Planctomycetes bacterium]|nr:PPC domain-containing protein [Planctomycetota bacterium]
MTPQPSYVRRHAHPSRWSWLAVLAMLTTTTTAQSQQATLPQSKLYAVTPVGARQGAEVELRTTAGENLERVDRLLFSHADIKATQIMDPPAVEGLAPRPTGRFRVAVGAKVPPGVYEVRTVGPLGASNPRAFVVDGLLEIAESGEHRTLTTALNIAVNTTVNATAEAAAIDFFSFDLDAGARAIVEVSGAQIDSKIDASVAVFDPSGLEIAHNPRATGRSDAVVDFEAPAKGRYTVGVHDLTYRGGPEFFYRLTARTGPVVVQVWPPVGKSGATSEVALVGRNLPGSKPDEAWRLARRPLDRTTTQVAFPTLNETISANVAPLLGANQATIDVFPFHAAAPLTTLNHPLLGASNAPVIVESEPNSTSVQAQTVTAPCEVVGRFDARGTGDWYQFTAKKGQALTVAVFSQRLGQSTDPQLVVQRVTKDAKGVEQVSDLAEVDDDAGVGTNEFTTGSSDCEYRFTAPDDGTYRVLVRDLVEGLVDVPRIYQLQIREAKPDFRLVAVSTRLPAAQAGNKVPNQLGNPSEPLGLVLRRGGSARLDVLVLRADGFDKPLVLSFTGLPKGVRAPSVTVGPSQSIAPVVLLADDSAEVATANIQVIGTAANDAKFIHTARYGTVTWPNEPIRNKIGARRNSTARLTSDLPLSVIEETSPFTVQWGDVSAAARQARGMKVELPIKVTRREGYKEAITVAGIGPTASFKSQPATIAAGATDGKLSIELLPTAPTEELAIYLVGQAKYQYKRDLGAAQLETARKQADKLVTDASDAAKKGEQAKQAATQAAAKAKAEADKAPAEKAAELKAKAADLEKARAAAEKAAIDAAAHAKRATEARDALAKQVADATKASAPKEVSAIMPSSPLVLQVRPTPVELSLAAATVTVKRGESVEATLIVTRLSNFGDKLPVEVVLPADHKGLTVTAPALEKAPKANVKIAAAADAKPGEFRVILRAKPKWSNQTVNVDAALTVRVE